MPQPNRAVVGALFLVIGSVGPVSAQTQTDPHAGFDTRFYFQPNNPPLEDETTGRGPSDPLPNGPELPSVKGFLKGLFSSPAEAAPAPAQSVTPPPIKEATGSESSRDVVTTSGTKAREQSSRALGRRIGSGRASYYEHAGRTASGEKYNPDGLTAAHKNLPLGTRLRVVNLQNRKSVVVRVNDRAPAKMKHAIDLSRGSARAIGISKHQGIGPVAIHQLN